jgi:hypothetical protein
MIQQVPIKRIKPNTKNPRVIKDSKFRQLVQSIKDFPQMLQLRPIVVNDEWVVLGGNQRLKACKEAGLEEVPVIHASELTPAQQQEFIVKDNVSAGEWDWQLASDQWLGQDLTTWGLELPQFVDTTPEPAIDEDIIARRLETYINATVKHITLYFNAERYAEVLETMKRIEETEGLNDNTEVVEFLIQMWEKNA